VLVVFIARVYASANLLQQQVMRQQSLAQVRSNLLHILSDNRALINTFSAVENNFASGPGMDCLKEPLQPCTLTFTEAGTPIIDRPMNVIKDAAGNISVDLRSPSEGLNMQGGRCTQFNSSIGSDLCPLQMRVKWSALCRPTSCINPQLKFTIEITYNPHSHSLKSLINEAKLGFSFYPPASRCQAGASYNPTTGNCDVNCLTAPLQPMPKMLFSSVGQVSILPPKNAIRARIKVWGAKGSNDTHTGIGYSYGGGGGYSEAQIIVQDWKPLRIVVGQYGGASLSPIGFAGNGRNSVYYNAPGGGLSGVFEGNIPVTANDYTRAIIIAGGGGGSSLVNTPATVDGWGGNGMGGMSNMRGANTATVADGQGGGGGGYRGGGYHQGGTGFISPAAIALTSVMTSGVRGGATANNADPDFLPATANGKVVIYFYKSACTP
jgi:hypothetical protein